MDNIKLWEKIKANSWYDVKPSNEFRWYDPEIAKAIAEEGKLIISEIEKLGYEYIGTDENNVLSFKKI